MLTGIGGIFGGLGGLGVTSLSAFLIDNGGDFIDFFRDQQEQLGIDQDPLQGASQVAVSGLPQIPSYNIKLSYVSNYIKNMKGVFEVSDTQRPNPSEQMIDTTLDLLAVTSKPKYRLIHDPATGTLKKILVDMTMVKDNDPNNLDERSVVFMPHIKGGVNIRKRNLIAIKITAITMDLATLLQITKQELSIKLGQTSTYIKNLPAKIRNNRIKSYKIYEKLLDWHDGIFKELEARINDVTIIVDFMKIYNKLKFRALRLGITELYQQFSVYKQTIQNKGFKLYTTFSEFLNDVLKNKIEPNKINFRAWCQESHHPMVSSQFTRSSRTVCKFCNQYTSYYDLKFIVEANGYTLKNPGSPKQWIDMILKSKARPSNIKITAVCSEHGEFDSTPSYQQRDIICKKCANEAKSLSLNEIKRRGEFFGLTLSRKMTLSIIRERLAKKQPLEWHCEIGHHVEALPFPSTLKGAYCEICAGGKITDERKVRYLLNRMFYTYRTGIKPVNYYNIDRLIWENINKNKKVSSYANSHHITSVTYPSSHIDYFIENFKIKGKYQNGKTFDEDILFGVEIWESHHKKDSKLYVPRVAEYDGLKQILYEEGFIDILIVVKTYELNGREYRDFIISELERQLKEKFGVVELDMNIGSISYNRVLRHLRQNLDNGNYKLDKWV